MRDAQRSLLGRGRRMGRRFVEVPMYVSQSALSSDADVGCRSNRQLLLCRVASHGSLKTCLDRQYFTRNR